MIDKLKQLAEIVYKNHNKINDKEVHQMYEVDGIEMYVYQNKDKISITALNDLTQRQINITANKYNKLFKSYNTIAKISYRTNKDLPTVIIDLIDKQIEEAPKETIHKLNSEINKDIKEIDIELIKYLKMKFGNDYVNKTVNVIEQLETIKSKRQNAGRKARFDQEQTNKILQLREDGRTIKELAKQFECGVATIHKLISENNISAEEE